RYFPGDAWAAGRPPLAAGALPALPSGASADVVRGAGKREHGGRGQAEHQPGTGQPAGRRRGQDSPIEIRVVELVTCGHGVPPSRSGSSAGASLPVSRAGGAGGRRESNAVRLVRARVRSCPETPRPNPCAASAAVSPGHSLRVRPPRPPAPPTRV